MTTAYGHTGTRQSRTTYRVTLPDGKEATRTSHKPYAYVVLVKGRPGDYWWERGWPWGVYRWSQSERSARNGAKEAARTGAYDEIRIQELNQEESTS